MFRIALIDSTKNLKLYIIFCGIKALYGIYGSWNISRSSYVLNYLNDLYRSK